jgi:beta-fructofuranosidase
MNYSPPGYYVWDVWYLNRYEEVHAFHLVKRRPQPGDVQRDYPINVNPLGHAISRNLLDWETLPALLAPDLANPHDDLQAWTGSAVWHEGQAHLFYTMRGSATQGREQKIGVAHSCDLIHWERYAGNPVLTPDPLWYATRDNPVPGVLDCRDLHVIPDPSGGWWGFFATRVHGSGLELAETSVVGCAHSADLIHWEQRPPAFAPKKYACIEAQDVFLLDGKWFMLCLTGNHYGNRGIWGDPHLVNGTIYAVSDRPEGPYHEMPDNALVAAKSLGPISCRSVSFQNQLFLLYTDRERDGESESGHSRCFGTISSPKLLQTSGDELRAVYSPAIEVKVKKELFRGGNDPLPPEDKPWGQIWPDPTVVWTQQGDSNCGFYRTGWSVRLLDCVAESFIFEVTLHLESALAAGIALRLSDPRAGGIVGIDAAENVVFFAETPNFDFMEKRRATVERGGVYRLRVVQRLEHIEIYLDDILKLAFCRYHAIEGKLGLFVDRGRCVFSDARIRSLDITKNR